MQNRRPVGPRDRRNPVRVQARSSSTPPMTTDKRAPTPVLSTKEKIAHENNRVTLATTIKVFLAAVLGLLVIAGVKSYKGEEVPKEIGQITVPLIAAVKTATSPEACGDNPPTIVVVGNEAEGFFLSYPPANSLQYGGFIRIEHFEEVKSWMLANPEREKASVEALASLMVPIPGFDFKETYAQSLRHALETNTPCVEIPNAQLWLAEALKAKIAILLTPTPEGISNYPTPRPLDKPPDVRFTLGIPGGEPPKKKEQPKKEVATIPKEAHVEVGTTFVDAFSKAIDEIVVSCKSSDQIVAAACVNESVTRFAALTSDLSEVGYSQKEERIAQALSKVRSTFQGCQNNLGVVPWNTVLQGTGPIWEDTQVLNAYGWPGALSLTGTRKNGQTVCALVTDSVARFGNNKWVTYPVDPYFPDYGGSPAGRGLISLGDPGGLYVQISKVYLSPAQ